MTAGRSALWHSTSGLSTPACPKYYPMIPVRGVASTRETPTLLFYPEGCKGINGICQFRCVFGYSDLAQIIER
jgi:hypothetical protein